jgi:hypothetical protein
VQAIPEGARFGRFGAQAPLLTVPLDGAAPALKSAFRYGDPYPAGWGRLASATVSFQVPMQVRGLAAMPELTATIAVSDRADKLAAGPSSR